MLLLGFHTYLMCYNLTTKEFIQGSKKSWYIRSKQGTIFSRATCWANIRDRLFPLEDDVCYTKRDVHDLLHRPIPPFRQYWSRFLAAFQDIWNEDTVQRMNKYSNKEL